MGQPFEHLLLPVQDFRYIQSTADFCYYNKSGNYYIKKNYTSSNWEVVVCFQAAPVSYNIASLNFLAKAYKSQVKYIQTLFQQVKKISTPTLKEAKNLLQTIYTDLFPKLEIDHTLRRRNYSSFEICNVSEDPFCYYISTLLVTAHKKSYVFKDIKWLEKSLGASIKIPSHFNTKPEIVRFLHNTVSSQLYALYLDKQAEYQEAKEYNYTEADLWWSIFLKPEIDLDQEF